MKGSERRKAPQLSAAIQADMPLKSDRHTVRAYVSSQTMSDLRKLSKKLFGSETEVPAVVRFAIQELVNSRLYQPLTSNIAPEVQQ